MSLPRINVYASDKGWLFEDFKRDFDGHEGVTCSELPDPSADAWICIRTKEAWRSPDLSRTVVQIHDMFERSVTEKFQLERCGAVVLTHPDQVIPFADRPVLCRPIGAKQAFYEANRQRPERFTVGWFGRMNSYKGRELLEWVLLALGPDFARVVLVGANLDKIRCPWAERFERDVWPHELWPSLYQTVSVVLITSTIEAGPLPLFEALASGVPVVSTGAGWGRLLLLRTAACRGFVAYSADGFFSSLREAKALWESGIDSKVDRDEVREEIGTQESWIADNIELARGLARTA